MPNGLENISPELVKTYQEEIEKRTSKSTAKRKMSSLRRFFDWAHDEGHIEEHPLPKVEPVFTPLAKKEPQKPEPAPKPSKAKRFIAPANILRGGIAVALIVLIFLLVGRVRLPIPSRKTPATETGPEAPSEGVEQPVILSPWTIHARMSLKKTDGTPVTGTQSIGFKLYKSEDDASPLHSFGEKQVTVNADGSTLIQLDGVPTEVFFENEKLYLAAEIGGSELDERLPVSTANVSANLQGYYPEKEATANSIPVLSDDGSLLLASEAPSVTATNGNLLVEGNTLTLSTPTASDGDITINPDGSGIAHFIFEGTGQNFLNAQGPNLTSGSLYYGVVANSATGYDLIKLESGSSPTEKFSVDAQGDTYVGGGLNVAGDIATNATTRLTSAGALTNIAGYTQDSGSFSITQEAGDAVTIKKEESALADLATLTLREEGVPNSIYSTLVLKRINGAVEAMALHVDEGNATFDGQLRLGRFSSAPTAIGTGTLFYNSTDGNVYVWTGTNWVSLGGATGSSIWTRLSGVIYPTTSTNDFAIGGTDSTAPFFVNDSGTITFSTDTNLYRSALNTLRTDDSLSVGGTISGDGSGLTGVDADTLDSYDSSSFLRSDVSDNYTTGTLTLDAGTTLNIAGTWQISGTSVTSTATELNYLDGTTVTAGGVIYANGVYLANTGVGSSDQILTSAGAGAPTWQNVTSLLTAGTDISISGTTNATIDNTSTLQTVTDRGATTTNLVNLNGGIVSQGARVGKALVIFDETGDQDILTASSSSGTTRFRITNSGDVRIGTGTFDNPSANEDAYVTGNLEVDGTIYGDGSGITGVTADSVSFDNITSGTNTSATMVVDTGASLDYSGSGTINASSLESLTASQFLRSDTSDNYTSGTLAFDAATTLDVNGDLSIADTDIAFDGASTTFTFTGNATLSSSSVTASDAFLVDGNTTLGDANTDTVTYNARVASNIEPSGDSTYDLGSNSLKWANVYADNLIGTISPGFTQGSVVFADGSGNLTEDNSDFFWDSTDNELGIGTNTPSEALDVIGNVEIDDDDTTGKGILLEAADRPIITRGWDSFTSGSYSGVGRWGVFMEPSTLTFGIPSGGTRYFKFKAFDADSTSSDLVTITSAGNVGIGTDSPGARTEIQVDAADNVTGLLLDLDDADETGLEVAADQTTGTVVDITADSLTSGTALSIGHSAAVGSTLSYNLLDVTENNTGGFAATSGERVDFNFSRSYTGGLSATETLNYFDIVRDLDVNAAGHTFTTDGALVRIASSGTETAGSLQDWSNILAVEQNCGTGVSCTGTVFSVTGKGTGDLINVFDNTDEVFTIVDGGDVGIGTTGPDAKLDSLSTTGEQLRLTYTDGSVYAGFTVDSGGDLTIAPSGGDTNITGNLSVSGNTTLGDSNTVDTLTGNLLTSTITSGATTQNAFTITGNSTTTGHVLDINATGLTSGSAVNVTGTSNFTSPSGIELAEFTYTASPGSSSSTGFTALAGTTRSGAGSYISNNLTGVHGTVINTSTSGNIHAARGVVGQIQSTGAGGTIDTAHSLVAKNPYITAGTVTDNYGLYVEDLTGGTNDYGIAIAGADTQALWISSGANNTDAANGIAFGSSRDTNLYRSAANTLSSDDSFQLAGDLAVNGGDITTTATTLNIDVANTGTINFRDGTYALAAVKDQGDYVFWNLKGKSDTGNPASCSEGDIYYNAFDDTLYVCHSGNTWEQLDGGGGGSSVWSDLTDPDANLSLAMAEYTTDFTWNTADSSAAFDAFTLDITNDATTDGGNQRLLVLANNDDSAATGTTENLLVLDNLDANEAVTTALSIADTGGGGFTTDISLQNSETIVNSTDSEIALSDATNTLTFDLDEDTATAIDLTTNGSIDLTLNPGGNVGVKTTTPGQELDVTGDIRLSGTLEGFGYSTPADVAVRTVSGDTSHLSLGAAGPVSVFIDTNNNDSTAYFSVRKDSAFDTGSGTELFKIDDSGNVGIGISTPTTALHVGSGSETHALSTGDVLISSDLEVDGIFYLDGGTLANSAGTGTMILTGSPTTSYNTLSTSSWLIENTANLGQAALMVNQTKGTDGTTDIFTASSSGTTRFRINRDGGTYITGSAATLFTVGGGSGKIDVGTVDPVYSIGGEKYATYMAGMIGVKEETTGNVKTTEYVPGHGYRQVIDFTAQEKGSDLWLFSKATDLKKHISDMVILLSAANNARAWYTVDPNDYTLSIYTSRPTSVSYRLTAPRFDADLWTNYNTNPESTGFLIDDDPLTVNGDGEIEEAEDNYLASLEITPSDKENDFFDTANFTLFDLKDEFGNILHQVDFASKFVAANIKAGAIETEQLIIRGGNFIAENIKAGAIEAGEVTAQSFLAFQASVDNLLVSSGLVSPYIETETISPIAGSDVIFDLDNSSQKDSSSFGKLIVQGEGQRDVASIDDQGNATFSGTVDAKKTKSDEIVAGKIYADEIIARSGQFADLKSATSSGVTLEQIEELLKEAQDEQSLLAESSDWNVDTATDSANLDELALSNLYVTNQAAVNQLSVTDSLVIGNDFSIQVTKEGGAISATSINTLSSPLEIQSLALAPVEIMAGLFRVDTNGDVSIQGNLHVAGQIDAQGLTLNQETEESGFLKLLSKEGSEIGGIDASGSAKFPSVETDRLIIAGADVNPQVPDIETGEIATNATAGTASIPAGITQITVRNEKVNDYTLVYITPISSTLNNVLFVKEKGVGYFVVGFNDPVPQDVAFNWWVIDASQAQNQ